MEVEITALVSKTRARTYEVPISYYGRSYEEGKKIGAIDGLMALAYIGYYNLVAPMLPSGRLYVRTVNAALASGQRQRSLDNAANQAATFSTEQPYSTG